MGKIKVEVDGIDKETEIIDIKIEIKTRKDNSNTEIAINGDN